MVAKFGIARAARSQYQISYLLWLVHVEIVEEDIRSAGIVCAGDQAHIAPAEGAVLRSGSLASVYKQGQVAANAIGAQVVARRAGVDPVDPGQLAILGG